MANLATKAPNFTRENAADMARRATVSREARRAREKAAATATRQLASDDARKTTTLRQIDKLDELINSSLDRRDAKRFLQLSAAKERLWKLVQPTAGALRPGRGSRRSDPPPMPMPQAATTPANPPAQ